MWVETKRRRQQLNAQRWWCCSVCRLTWVYASLGEWKPIFSDGDRRHLAPLWRCGNSGDICYDVPTYLLTPLGGRAPHSCRESEIRAPSLTIDTRPCGRRAADLCYENSGMIADRLFELWTPSGRWYYYCQYCCCVARLPVIECRAKLLAGLHVVSCTVVCGQWTTDVAPWSGRLTQSISTM